MSPLIPNPRLLLANERRYTQQLQSSSDLQATLAAANDKNLRVTVGELHLLLALCDPLAVVRGKVAFPAGLLGEVSQTLQIGEDVVSLPLPLAISVVDGYEAEDTRARADVVVEGEVTANPREVFVQIVDFGEGELEVREFRACKTVSEELLDLLWTLERAQIPGKGENVAPPRVVCETRQDTVDIALLYNGGERVEPVPSNLLMINILDFRGRNAELSGGRKFCGDRHDLE